MTFRQVPASEGDAMHVSIETVASNSPAALADLQKGDRLISIGGQRHKTTNKSVVDRSVVEVVETIIICIVFLSVSRCQSDIFCSSAQTVEASWRKGANTL